MQTHNKRAIEVLFAVMIAVYAFAAIFGIHTLLGAISSFFTEGGFLAWFDERGEYLLYAIILALWGWGAQIARSSLRRKGALIREIYELAGQMVPLAQRITAELVNIRISVLEDYGASEHFYRVDTPLWYSRPYVRRLVFQQTAAGTSRRLTSRQLTTDQQAELYGGVDTALSRQASFIVGPDVIFRMVSPAMMAMDELELSKLRDELWSARRAYEH